MTQKMFQQSWCLLLLDDLWRQLRSLRALGEVLESSTYSCFFVKKKHDFPLSQAAQAAQPLGSYNKLLTLAQATGALNTGDGKTCQQKSQPLGDNRSCQHFLASEQGQRIALILRWPYE